MRPIDADAFITRLEHEAWSRGRIELLRARDIADETPTIDAVPVRHGKWTVEWETEDTRMLRCSECRMVFNVGNGRDGNYCPNCGARMDEDNG